MAKRRIKWNVARAAFLLTAVIAGSYMATKSFAEQPASTVKKDYVAEHIQEEGFKEYIIPTEYANNGGHMDTWTQKRAWYACHGYHVNYPMVLAIIEAESGYQNNAVSEAGAVGYMQIIPKWHEDKIGPYADIRNAETNIIVGIRYLAELQQYCNDTNYLLMSYNMGLSEATKLWERGVYSTEYSRKIIKRADEISRMLEGAYL